MKTLVSTLCAIALGTSLAASPIDLSDTYSSFVSFGDSLTDDGKFGGTPFTPGPPSFEGRFSNGPTFAEDVADDFSTSLNFAIGGATATPDNEEALPPEFGTFGGQVANFASFISVPPLRATLGDRPLFSVLFGANDILQNIGFPGDFDIVPGIGALAADAIAENIRAIRALDASFTDFAVMNLPDLSQTPLFLNPAFGAGVLAPLAAAETAGFNMQLASNIDDLRSDGLNIIEFDLQALFGDLIADAQLAGIDTLNPCTFERFNQDPANTCVFSPGSPDNIDLALADNFFFVDQIHPNRVVHATFADEFRNAFAPAAVPLPAGLPLMLVGLGAFALVRRRATG